MEKTLGYKDISADLPKISILSGNRLSKVDDKVLVIPFYQQEAEKLVQSIPIDMPRRITDTIKDLVNEVCFTVAYLESLTSILAKTCVHFCIEGCICRNIWL